MQKRFTRNMASFKPKDYCEACGYKPDKCEYCHRVQSSSKEMVQCHGCGNTYCIDCITHENGTEKCPSCGSNNIGDARI